MSQFDWQTDENWEKESNSAESTSPTPYKRHLLSAILLLLLLSIPLLALRKIRQRTAIGITATEADIQAAFNMLSQAEQNSDIDLFKTVLSGSNSDWTSDRLAYRKNAGVYNHSGLGMELVGEPQLLSIEIDPDFASAELQIETTYTYTARDNQTTPFTLTQTHIYRDGQRNWLLAPPQDKFWGKRAQRIDGQHLIYFPERDSEVMETLLPLLAQDFDRWCENRQSLCDEPYTLHFTTTPDSLLTTLTTDRFLDSRPAERRIELPTPSLLGLPNDATGYAALQSAYMRHIAMATTADWYGYTCCVRVQFFEALVNAQLE
ncbi:MAG: hypothetical protein KAG66_05505, partial [Methylococcales bacterium]|nr:hypothetical protein [Methylococcales bacterium]